MKEVDFVVGNTSNIRAKINEKLRIGCTFITLIYLYDGDTYLAVFTKENEIIDLLI
jgi:hypothetical protein